MVTGYSPPLGALPHAGERGPRLDNHLVGIERRELAAAFEDAAVDHDGVDVFRAVASSTRCAGSVTTAMLSASVPIAIRSARLPGLSEPILSSIPIARAPSMVPSSSALRAVLFNSLSALAFSDARASLSTR